MKRYHEKRLIKEIKIIADCGQNMVHVCRNAEMCEICQTSNETIIFEKQPIKEMLMYKERPAQHTNPHSCVQGGEDS